MPLVTKEEIGQNSAPKVYKNSAPQQTISFGERMHKLFAAQQFVLVTNIDNEDVYWQYLPEANEDSAMTPDGMQRIITRGEPEVWVLRAGATEALVGASAYLCLDAMYKQMQAKKVPLNGTVVDKNGVHTPRNFNFSDSGAQEAFLEKAYKGIATPTFSTGVSTDEPEEQLPPQAAVQTSTTAEQPSIKSMEQIKNENKDGKK